jgi:DNA-binding beta-propeller fold protein YncE/4-amino-4-deoxy-L-arabinose transferase-like glycosyltransferase
MADMAATQTDSVLDRTIDLTRVSWWSVAAALTLAGGVLLRFIGLDWVALSVDESRRSLQALAFYDGRPLPGMELPETSPALLLGQALSFLLFGVTDVTARLITALAGIAIIAFALLLAPFVGRTAAIGMGIAAAISPTLLYSSREAGPETLVACFGLLFVLSLLYAGRAAGRGDSPLPWAALTGVALAAMFGSGPSSISVLISICAGLALAGLAEQGGQGAVRRGIFALTGSPLSLVAFVAGFSAALIALFTRGFSSISGLSGIAETFGNWIDLLTSESSATPTQFFLLSVLLYELVLVLGAVAGFLIGLPEPAGGLSSIFFLGWFVAALIIFSFSAGRLPEHAIHVALPIVLLGGAGIASIIASLGWRFGRWKSSALLLGASAALIGAVIAFAVSLGNIDRSNDQGRAVFESLTIVVIAIVPLAIATFVLLRERIEGRNAGAARTIAAVALAALTVFLGAFLIRSTVLLSYYRADPSLELLAQRTSPPAVKALARQIDNLSRDLTLLEPTVQDPTGGHGIAIAIESDVEWPYRWYFREYPDLQIVEPGAGVATAADLVIARESVEMDTSGYTPRLSASRNRVPPEYLTPSFGSVLRGVFIPSHWEEGVDFLLYREGITQPDPETVAVGYGSRLSQQLFTSTGPYAITERVGTGAGRGQFNQPRGVAVNSGDGAIYVVDSANGRIQRFDASGQFTGAWGGPESGVTFEVTAEGLGPTGIDVSFEGLIFVADTWGHRVVALNNDGQVVREFGTFGDTVDSPVAVDLPGQFFGPRDIAITATEIYVVDTGNERVQVFTPDGTFVRSWGGYGSNPDQFVEPVGIAVGPDDRVYVADSGNGRISIFARDGTPLEQWTVEAWQGQLYFEPYLAFDQYGRLYATSSGTASVEVFNMNGELVASLASAGTEPFEAPIGIALGIDNTVKVSDRAISAVLALPVLSPDETPPDEPATPESATPLAVDELLPASPVASPRASPLASPEASPEP